MDFVKQDTIKNQSIKFYYLQKTKYKLERELELLEEDIINFIDSSEISKELIDETITTVNDE